MKSIKFLTLGLVALFGLLLIPAFAQDVQPGQGGVIIEGNFGGDPATFNPITASDTASRRITGFLFPGLIGVNPETAIFEQNRPDALVDTWEISEDGLVYTFTIKQDWTWSDGTPMTTKDILYTWGAILAGVEGVVDTPLTFITETIENVEAVDDFTFVVTMKTAACNAFGNIGALYPAPSHVLPADYAELNDAEFNLSPSVTGGVFSFGELRSGEQVSLLADQNYPGAANGVLPEGFIYSVVPDQTVLLEQFLAGDTNVIDGPAVNRRADLRANADVTVYPFPGNAWDYLALNYADPNDPVDGVDEAGEIIEQAPHPIFGDVRVRQAVALAINVDEIVQGAVFGEGDRMTSVIIPASWAYAKDLPPIEFNPEAAAALLDEAGWVDDDNDAATPRVASGAMFAEDGTPLSFVLYTNEGNTRRGAVGTIVQDALSQIGFQVDFQAIDFNTLLDIIDSQSFDAVILGWRNGYPDDPDLTQLFKSASDIVGSGSNFTSYVNAEVDALIEEALNVPGCDIEARRELYVQLQEMIQKDLPYVPLFTIGGMYAARTNVEGFAPFPSQLFWNVDTWVVRAP